MRVYFRHAKPREEQQRLIKDTALALQNKQHLVAHASTGIGKTDAVISAALSYALENGKNVFFLTPKISQHKIAVEVLKGLGEKYELNFTGIDLIGRKHMCPDQTMKRLGSDDFYELCSKKKKKQLCSYYEIARGSSGKNRELGDHRLDKIRSWYGKIRSHSELCEHCESITENELPRVPCSYEIAVKIGENANFVIGDYYHLLNKGISGPLLQKMNKKNEDNIVIIDEAHNAPERIRTSLSASINSYIVSSAEKECLFTRNKQLKKQLEKISLSLEEIEKSREKRESIVYKEEIPMPDESTLTDLKETGVQFLEASNRSHSACLKIKKFYENWEHESNAYLRVMKKHARGTSIYHKCLDPSVYTGEILNSVHSAILMSGTLKPGEMYRDLLGLDEKRTVLKEYASPFPKKNRLNLLVEETTTKYESRNDKEYDKTAVIISRIVENTPGNTAIFFPSYAIQSELTPRLTDLLKKPMFIQNEKSKPSENAEMLEDFRKHAEDGAVLIGVAGGSFAEGIDLPGKELITVIVVGIPLNEPDLETQALIEYYDFKFGKGWEYGYTFPAMSKAVQAGGRCIRSENDRGVVVFMDKRFKWKRYSQCFPRELDFKITEKPEEEVKKFWSATS